MTAVTTIYVAAFEPSDPATGGVGGFEWSLSARSAREYFAGWCGAEAWNNRDVYLFSYELPGLVAAPIMPEEANVITDRVDPIFSDPSVAQEVAGVTLLSRRVGCPSGQ